MTESQIIKTLVKFSTFEYITALQQGKLYIHTVDYFRTCENSIQSDFFEGVSTLHQADRIKSIIIESKIHKKIILTKDTGLINFTAGNNINYFTNIFCMYLWKIYKDQPNKIDSRIFSFGDTALLILNSNEFINRIKNAIKSKNYKYSSGKVKYFDEEIYSGEVGIFMKRKSLEFMNEYRIAIQAEMNNRPYELFVGDLSDISIVIKTNDINNIQFQFSPDKQEALMY